MNINIMSKYLSIFALLIICHSGLNAQKIKESGVPEVVKTNFSRMFPNTPVIEWEIKNGNYEADYKQKDVVSTMVLTPEGKIVQYENSIPASELPEAIKNYIITNLSGKKMGTITRIKTVTGNISYKIEAGDAIYDFDSDGNITGNQK
jgi:hypothetical protein